MIDITHKNTTLRKATAGAIVKVSKAETIEAVVNKKVPKGDVLEMSKTAGLFAAKKTAELIPDCHPMPVESTAINFDIAELEIHIEVEVKTVYKTGVEVEAMHAASVVALTIYDMLKPIDKGIEIHSIRLIEKKGGKSDYKDRFRKDINAAVVVCSDTISKGQKEDKAGRLIAEKLEGMNVDVKRYEVIPDEKEQIESNLRSCLDENIDLIIYTGGTGLSVRDVTPDAIRPFIERDIPGIMEASRDYGQQRMPYAMLSRGVAGTIGSSLVLTLPGSTNGARESMDALFPSLLHIFNIIGGGRHD